MSQLRLTSAINRSQKGSQLHHQGEFLHNYYLNEPFPHLSGNWRMATHYFQLRG